MEAEERHEIKKQENQCLTQAINKEMKIEKLLKNQLKVLQDEKFVTEKQMASFNDKKLTLENELLKTTSMKANILEKIGKYLEALKDEESKLYEINTQFTELENLRLVSSNKQNNLKKSIQSSNEIIDKNKKSLNNMDEKQKFLKSSILELEKKTTTLNVEKVVVSNSYNQLNEEIEKKTTVAFMLNKQIKNFENQIKIKDANLVENNELIKNLTQNLASKEKEALVKIDSLNKVKFEFDNAETIKKELKLQEKRISAELNCLSKNIDSVKKIHNLNLYEIGTQFLHENEIKIKMEQINQNFKENLNEFSNLTFQTEKAKSKKSDYECEIKNISAQIEYTEKQRENGKTFVKDSTDLIFETEEKLIKGKLKENINAISERCNEYKNLRLKQNEKTEVDFENENTNYYEHDLHR